MNNGLLLGYLIFFLFPDLQTEFQVGGFNRLILLDFLYCLEILWVSQFFWVLIN